MNTVSLPSLPSPPHYFPLSRGRFDVTPGFFPLTTAFGNGEMDKRLFQISTDWQAFRANTIAARAQRLEKYILWDAKFPEIAYPVSRFLATRLVAEYPALFAWKINQVLHCRLSGERLHFDSAMRLTSVDSPIPISPPYQDAFDALISQVPEDMAVVLLPEDAPDTNIALHVTAPSHWVPSEKIGRSFLETHIPVPHFERIASASGALMNTLLTRPPMVRFNWGIEFTSRLNLHPEPPHGVEAAEWNRRLPSPADQHPIYLRLERQVLWGLPECRILVFAIRVFVEPISALSTEQRDALRRTLLSMPEESRIYKGLSPEVFKQTAQALQELPA